MNGQKTPSTEFQFNGFKKEEIIEKIINSGMIPAKQAEEFRKTVTLIDAEYRHLGTFRVLVSAPDPAKDNKYMFRNPASYLVCWDKRLNKQVAVAHSSEHWTRNLLVNCPDQKGHVVLRRNFRGLEECHYGKNILADVTITRQKNFHKNTTTIILDFQVCADDGSKNIYCLGQGVKPSETRSPNTYQFPIPGTDKVIKLTPKSASHALSKDKAA